jgi:hypothetical protein
VERWGLFLGFALGAVAFALAGVALYWQKGPVLWAWATVFVLCFWAAVMSVRAFESRSR